ncbi:MAG: hypothetical protein ACXADC_03195 [Candidatus Thorarchaeota archaeon]
MDGIALVLAFGLVSLIVGSILFLLLEIQTESRATDKKLVGYFIRHPTLTELIIQTSIVGGISIFSIVGFLISINRDSVLAYSFILLTVVAGIPSVFTIHRRMRSYREFLSRMTDIKPSADLEVLEPLLKAKVTLGAWFVSIVSIIISFLIYEIDQFYVISRVMMFFGAGGLVFLSCPAVFSIFTLREKKQYDNV